MSDSFSYLLQVEKPARYIGGEWNSITKDAATVRLRLCLAFPDLYELGLGNLGLQVLYNILNELPEVWAERTYLPGPDMASLMHQRGLPLRMLESQDPVAKAHGIGFTLQSELTYVNILKMLQLAGIPLFAADREEEGAPIIFAGGPGAYNPEPLAPFMDFFVIGDGEEIALEIVECFLQFGSAGRQKLLRALAEIQGIYVPSLFPMEYLDDGRIFPAVQYGRVTARTISNLDTTLFPSRPITPYVQLVHDGVAIEVLRGCTNGCRFCQAGMITRPVRERTINTVSDLLKTCLLTTGMEDATLLSLSTCDYSQVKELLQCAAAIGESCKAAIALPSVRMDRFSVGLADYVASMRRSGLTFAPEAGTERLRAVINKNVSDNQLLDIAEEAFRKGWTHIKLYFMIGLPTETEADLSAIADLCIRTLDVGKRVQPRAQVRLGVSTFVPKPFTPFQWAAQISMEETRVKQRKLLDLLRPYPRIIFGRHAPETSFIEGLLSRADRRAANVLVEVLRRGGGYETWEEKLTIDAWHAAIASVHYPVEALFSERPEDERFPWDFIQAPVSKEALLKEWKRAQQGIFTPDCRLGACNRCGANQRMATVCTLMQQRSKPSLINEALELDREIDTEQRISQLCRVRLRVGRTGRLRFLSHLETMQAWIRACRRAGLPIAYSKGFHAHPKLAFATALPVGEESEAELMDIVLEESLSPEIIVRRLQQYLPQGLHVYEAWEIDPSSPSLTSQLHGFSYLLQSPMDFERINKNLQTLYQKPVWQVRRFSKSRSSRSKQARQEIRVDIRPAVVELAVWPGDPCENGQAVEIRFTTIQAGGKLAKPKDIITLLEMDPLQTRILKTHTHLILPQNRE